jgi:hypothetical protein
MRSFYSAKNDGKRSIISVVFVGCMMERESLLGDDGFVRLWNVGIYQRWTWKLCLCPNHVRCVGHSIHEVEGEEG